MKIAIIGARGMTHTYGGIERVLVQLCPRLAALGHEVHVFGDRMSTDVADMPGVKSIPVPSLGGKYTETITRSIAGLAKALSKDYDVINLVAVGPGILSPLPRLAGIPVVVSIHGLDWARDKWPWPARLALRAAERTIVKSAHQITVVSEQLVDYLRNSYGREAIHAPNGIEVDTGPADPEILAELGLKNNGYVLFASRLVKEKGAHELVEAFNRVKTDKRLVIAGGDRYDSGYVEALRRADQTGRCVFTGHLAGAQLEHVFKGAALYVLPSHIEGFSLSLLEALGYGKPILFSNIPENIEAVGEAGMQFPVRDVDALTHRLQRLVGSPKELDLLGSYARHRAATLYSWDAVSKCYVSAYEAAIRNAASPRLGTVPRRLVRYLGNR